MRAYVYHEGGSAEVLDTLEAVAAIVSRDTARIWIDLEAPTEADVHTAGQLYQLDGEALEDCLHGEQRPRIDEFEGYVFVVLYGLVGPIKEEEVAPRKLAAFFGERFLITVHRDPLLTVREVRGRLERNASQVLSRGLDFVFYSIIAGIYGMNLPLWPNPEQSKSFWGVLGVMAAITVGMLGYFRHKRWI